MKWIYIVENPLEKHTAGQTHVLEFCHALAKIDEVILISQANPSTLSQVEDFGYLQINPIQIRPHNLGDILNTIKAFFYVNRQIKTSQPDVVYERATSFGIGPLISARINNIPAILEVNGNWEDEHRWVLKQLSFPKKQFVGFINALRGHSITIACRIAGRLIVVTPNLVDFLIQKKIGNKEKILVVPNGVNVERFIPLDKMTCKNSLGLQPDVDYVGFIGSLSAWQGVEDLILAYSELPQELKTKFHLLIVGDGPEYKRCNDIKGQLKLGNSVIFTGAQPYQSIPKYISACSVLAAPIKPRPCSPLKIYEYMACARPIIASNIEDLEFVERQGVGVLFSPGDIKDFAEKLQDILNLPEDKKKVIGERARHLVEENYSWDAVVQTVRQFVISGSTNKKTRVPVDVDETSV